MNSSQLATSRSDDEDFTPSPMTYRSFSRSFETRGEKSESPDTRAKASMWDLPYARSRASTTMRMSAEFLPLYRDWGTSISSIAHSWNGRLYSVKRFQSAYARRTMILPFSSSRSSTSLISKALYCASLTPRAMFSKSMNSASLRSPFIRDVLSCADPFSGEGVSQPLYGARRTRRKASGSRGSASRGVYSGGRRHGETTRRALEVTDEATGRGSCRTDPPGANADGEVARPHLRPDAQVRSGALDVPLLRARRARGRVDVGGVPQAPPRHDHLRRPLRDALVEARQRLGRRAHPGDRESGEAAPGRQVRDAARRPGLHDQHRARGSRAGRRPARPQAQRTRPRARPRRPDATGRAAALLLEEREVAPGVRVPGRQPAGLLGAERIPHARRSLDGGAVLRPGDARDADDARRSRAQAARPVTH